MQSNTKSLWLENLGEPRSISVLKRRIAREKARQEAKKILDAFAKRIANKQALLKLDAITREGTEFLYENETAILGDETGVGKTGSLLVATYLQSLAASTFDVFVVVPNRQIVKNWQSDLERLLAPATPDVIHESFDLFDRLPDISTNQQKGIATLLQFYIYASEMRDRLKRARDIGVNETDQMEVERIQIKYLNMLLNGYWLWQNKGEKKKKKRQKVKYKGAFDLILYPIDPTGKTDTQLQFEAGVDGFRESLEPIGESEIFSRIKKIAYLRGISGENAEDLLNKLEAALANPIFAEAQKLVWEDRAWKIKRAESDNKKRCRWYFLPNKNIYGGTKELLQGRFGKAPDPDAYGEKTDINPFGTSQKTAIIKALLYDTPLSVIIIDELHQNANYDTIQFEWLGNVIRHQIEKAQAEKRDPPKRWGATATLLSQESERLFTMKLLLNLEPMTNLVHLSNIYKQPNSPYKIDGKQKYQQISKFVKQNVDEKDKDAINRLMEDPKTNEVATVWTRQIVSLRDNYYFIRRKLDLKPTIRTPDGLLRPPQMIRWFWDLRMKIDGKQVMTRTKSVPLNPTDENFAAFKVERFCHMFEQYYTNNEFLGGKPERQHRIAFFLTYIAMGMKLEQRLFKILHNHSGIPGLKQIRLDSDWNAKKTAEVEAYKEWLQRNKKSMEKSGGWDEETKWAWSETHFGEFLEFYAEREFQKAKVKPEDKADFTKSWRCILHPIRYLQGETEEIERSLILNYYNYKKRNDEENYGPFFVISNFTIAATGLNFHKSASTEQFFFELPPGYEMMIQAEGREFRRGTEVDVNTHYVLYSITEKAPDTNRFRLQFSIATTISEMYELLMAKDRKPLTKAVLDEFIRKKLELEIKLSHQSSFVSTINERFNKPIADAALQEKEDINKDLEGTDDATGTKSLSEIQESEAARYVCYPDMQSDETCRDDIDDEESDDMQGFIDQDEDESDDMQGFIDQDEDESDDDDYD